MFGSGNRLLALPLPVVYTGGKMSAGQRRPFLRAMALVVLLGAILPQVTYVGHWHLPGLPRPAAADHDHADHCHGDSACADGGGAGIVWWAQDSDAPTLGGDPQRAQTPPGDPAPAEPAIDLLDPPPRYA